MERSRSISRHAVTESLTRISELGRFGYPDFCGCSRNPPRSPRDVAKRPDTIPVADVGGSLLVESFHEKESHLDVPLPGFHVGGAREHLFSENMDSSACRG